MNTQIEQAIQYRDNYQDYIASLPASIYNNNIEIYQANLERMNQEIDRLIEEAEVDAQLLTLTPGTTEADADALHDLLEALDNGDWLGEVTARQYGDADLGTRFTISGGEVMELDGHLESRYDEQNGGDDLPF